MKKSLLLLLALLLAASMLLTACDLGDTNEPTEETTTAAEEDDGGNGGGNGGGNNKKPDGNKTEIPSEPPTGYEFFSIGNFRVAVPADWESEQKTDYLTIFSPPNSSYNSIEVITSAGAKVYYMLNEENASQILPSTPKNLEMLTKTNDFGVTVKCTSFEAKVEHGDASCYLFAIKAQDAYYAIGLTDYEGSITEEMLTTMFQSMVIFSGVEDDPAAPNGYKTHTTNNFRFAVPENWLYETTVDDYVFLFTLDDVKIVMTYYVGEEAEICQSEEVLAGFPGEIENKTALWAQNDSGLHVYLLSFHATMNGSPVDYYIFGTEIDGVDYGLIINDTDGTLAEVAATILHSMEKIN